LRRCNGSGVVPVGSQGLTEAHFSFELRTSHNQCKEWIQ
jgi:hypothetical protein